MLVATVIREATPADIPALVAMGMRFGHETDYGRLIQPDPDRLTALVTGILTSPDGVIFVSEGETGPDGMIALMAVQHPMSFLRIVSELVWWVNPEARGSGRDLVTAAEAWARTHGDLFVMIAPDARVGALYARAGYSVLETAYYRRL